jgi:hypothetical protein
VDNLEEIKRLEEMKTKLLKAIELHSELRHLTNEKNYQSILHYVNDKHRDKIKTVEAMLDELKQ